MKRPAARIRLLSAGELDRLARLHGACFEESWDVEALATLLAMPGAFAFVSETDNGDFSGFLMSRVAADEAEIVSFGVHPDVRRNGMGRRLLAAARREAAARGARRLYLEVAAGNLAALALYSSEGFAEVGRRPDYYHKAGGDGSALVMAADITIGSVAEPGIEEKA